MAILYAFVRFCTLLYGFCTILYDSVRAAGGLAASKFSRSLIIRLPEISQQPN
jgi:hypothetical protein